MNAVVAMEMAEVIEASDVLHADQARRFNATIGIDDHAPGNGKPAELLSHWLCFLPFVASPKLGIDGHPSRAGDTVLSDFPRRMWAGSEIAFQRPLRIGQPITRRSEHRTPEVKAGRSGRMIFQHIHHEIRDADGPILSEVQHIVYRPAAQPGDMPAIAQQAPITPQWERRVDPDPVLLFRYSALTFNSHRIHYDRTYAIECEGYPGLVVHGPLAATLLLQELLARHPGIDVATYRFRALRPMFDGAPFFVCGSLAADNVAHLFARDASGALCVDATATLRQTP